MHKLTFKITRNVCLVLVAVIAMISCQPSTADQTSVQIPSPIKRSMEVMSESEAWSQLKRLSFDKQYVLYDSLGKEERSVLEHHVYNKHEDQYQIIQTNDTLQTVTRFQDGQTTRTQNGELLPNQVSFQKSINAARYVISLPYHLIDPSVRFKEHGMLALPDEKYYHGVSVLYDASKNQNHSSSEEWVFYFDIESGFLKANKIFSSDHISLVINDDFELVESMYMYKNRSSYRVDSSGQVLYLRATYLYSNYELFW